ncbi:SURF1 family-domain-containing protein [Naematelia encephala]|uniref:SURF1-like protein n=1 Tax=Naematelia encephala TaxID=71784 RepID=A0A1Y2AM96_9TREE|nr:SURF1 family-domain-containing protein [Naematelia encephala]
MPIVTFFLGVWQVKRLRWKLDLIEEIERNIEREPMLLPPHVNLTALPDFAFRRVLLKGHFEGPPLLFGPIVEQGFPGYALILPFVRSPLPNSTTVPSTILVNRGFITKTRAEGIKAGTEPVPGLKDGEVVIEGMLTKRFTEGKGSWTPENEPEKNEWFWKDAKGMAEFVGGEERGVQPVLVDAIDDGSIPSSYLMQQGIPVGRPPTVEVRNQHATYAMTWFSLSAATAIMLVLLFRRGKGKKVLPTRSLRI